MRKPSAFEWLAVAAGVASLLACSESSSPTTGCAQKVVTSEQSCAVSADCTAAGLDLSCIDGVCRLACRTDADCDLVANADPSDDPECRADPATTPTAICQAGVCEVGCPDQPCGGGEVCFEGRCALYAEGFELPPGAGNVDLALLGFNDPPPELPNTRTQILWSGPPGCAPGVDRFCSGPAGQGDRFVVIETQPIPPKGTPVTDTTCRACACCLECLAAPPPTPVALSACPRTPNIPTPLSCPMAHPSCDAVCTACDQCPAADRPSVANNPLLVSCEERAAERRCGLCDACDTFLATCQPQQCPVCATAPNSADCRTCVDTNCLSDQRCQDCLTCADAQNCSLNDPGSAACNQLNDACDLLGADGCFNVPVDYLRAQLTDEEQALTSPAVALAAAAGTDVVMEFDYVAFDVGVSYFPGIQGTPPELWTERPQDVRVQFCAGPCAAADWVDATLTSGGPAVLPADSERFNGRLLGDQTIVDWRAGRISVAVPPSLRANGFRYRLLPNLADGARLAIDNVQIRRVP